MKNENMNMPEVNIVTTPTKKQLGAIALLAGTAIGSGMISLPMVLAKFGLVSTSLIMLAFAFLTYLTALIRSDLNLCSSANASLADVGKTFGNKSVGIVGDFMLKLLHFALMAAYISGGASIVNSFCGNVMSTNSMILLFSIAISMTFLFASDIVVHVNKFLFIAMFSILIVLVAALFIQTPISVVPEQASDISLKEWTTLVPVIFTSFGFQGSIHSMTKFCDNDPKLIKRACIWGSVIPAIVYIVWTAAILLVVANTDADFFRLMLDGKATDVGRLVAVLSVAASSKSIQLIVWIVSAFAILTSVLGVGLALLDLDFFKDIFAKISKKHTATVSKIASVMLVVFVPAIVAMIVPGAFIRILNIAGIILAVMAIIVPTIISFSMQDMLEQQKGKKRGEKSNDTLEKKRLLQSRVALCAVFACGVVIVLLGIADLF